MAEVKQTTKTERPQLCHTEICEPDINKSNAETSSPCSVTLFDIPTPNAPSIQHGTVIDSQGPSVKQMKTLICSQDAARKP